MPGREPLKKTRHPGVYLADGRLVIRWTVQERGRRKDYLETMPDGATLADAVALREKRIADEDRDAGERAADRWGLRAIVARTQGTRDEAGDG